MNIHLRLPQKAVNYFKHLPSAFLALLFYQFPSKRLKVIGVTGTDGKTTTVNLIYNVLKESGLSVSMISTVSALIKDKEIDTGFHVTAPGAWQLQKLLRRMVREGIKYVVLEVTSHGLDQFRVLGISYEVGVMTNVTYEHLDYHKTYESYLRTKAKLFEKSKVAVLNKDDRSYGFLSSKFKVQSSKFVTYGIKNEADFTPKTFPFKTSLPGEYNQYNCLAAITATKALGVKEETIRKAVAEFEGVIGRMEEVGEGQNFRAIVDFAHTPNALEQALKTLKKDLKKDSRLIVVFGAAGLRDREKRPMMGKIAGTYADFSVVTAEDPRTEKVEDICRQIAQGCREVGGKFKIIYNRQEAINYAIEKLAKIGDIVVVCGKGHEKSMCYGTKEYPWSDQEAVRKALQEVSKVSQVSKVSKTKKEAQ